TIARRVLQEGYRRRSRERSVFHNLERQSPKASVAEEVDPRLPCLHKCLQQLPEASRLLILSYYDGDGRAHLSERKALADQLGLTYVTLKVRAHRARCALEACLGDCLGTKAR